MAIILAVALMVTPIADTGTQVLSKEDHRLFTQIIEAEAHPSWGVDGYTLLAQTVMNQLETDKYGDTIREVLLFGNNYSVYTNGRYSRVEVSDKARVAVNLAIRHSDYMNYGQLYFCTLSHLRRNPNGLHGRSEKVYEYRNVAFFK